MLRFISLLFVTISLTGPALVGPAFAWGEEGHSIVAELAQRHLAPKAASRLDDLLGGKSLASLSNWADDYRDAHEETLGWHFVNIPAAANNFDDARDCTEDPVKREGDCIIHAISREIAVLSDAGRPRNERLTALKFLVHFIGDLHQPLHAVGDFNGYNQFDVCYFSGPSRNDCLPTKLHTVWDTGLIRSLYYNWGAYVDYLEEMWVPAQDLDKIVVGTVIDWALEAHQASQSVAVSNLKAGAMLGADYLAAVRPTLDRQLGAAGLRLASVLNGIFALPKPKVMIVSLFEPEAEPWLTNLKIDRKIRIPGLSPDFPQISCSGEDVCVMTTGMAHTNAAASMMALLFSRQLDLSKTYFILAGIAGIDPGMGTLGSPAWARYLVDFGLQNEIDAREMPLGWSTGYLGIHAHDPSAKPALAYKTEVFQLNEGFLQKALSLSVGAQLADSPKAAEYRAHYPSAPANQPPKVIQCDTLAGDTYWHGALIGQRAHDWVALLTDGKGTYCTTQQEDNAVYEAMKRAASAGLVDLDRLAVLRVASNFDRPYPTETADTSLHASSGGFSIATENIYRAAGPVVRDIVGHWDRWEIGVPP
jgi:purine nucleoside permease